MLSNAARGFTPENVNKVKMGVEAGPTKADEKNAGEGGASQHEKGEGSDRESDNGGWTVMDRILKSLERQILLAGRGGDICFAHCKARPSASLSTQLSAVTEPGMIAMPSYRLLV